MDDILFAGRNFEDLQQKMEIFLEFCRSKNIKLKPSKFQIASSVEFGGCIVSRKTLGDSVFIEPKNKRILAFVWHYRSPRLYFIWVLFFTTCSQLEGDGRRVLMCPPHLKLQLCRAAIGSISCPWGRNSCAMFLRNYRTIASIALGLGVTIHLPLTRSFLYQPEKFLQTCCYFTMLPRRKC